MMELKVRVIKARISGYENVLNSSSPDFNSGFSIRTFAGQDFSFYVTAFKFAPFRFS